MSKQNEINASPTKEFFISMITRDIPIDRAILDLIDNSVDAANRYPKEIKKKKIEITFDEKKFSIFDNCGGILLEDAKSYAFRFGRTNDDTRLTPNSVGQFGVGMKRTLFKLGNKFSIKTFNDINFGVDVDVNKWIKDTKWSFSFKENNSKIKKGETLVESYDLFDETVRDFRNPNFEKEIIKEIEKAHFTIINKGLNIFVNSKKLETYKIELKASKEIKPTKITFSIDDVTVTITAGIAERDLKEGGWYIICNGRLIEEAEQTEKTGWETRIPQYHPDYAFFRGIVEFHSENSSKLPWTTTKTGVDTGHKVYRTALEEMIKVIKPIIAALKSRLREEKDFEDKLIKVAPFLSALKNAPLLSFQEIPTNNKFEYPEPTKVNRNNSSVNITYSVPKEKMSIVKDSLGSNLTNKQVGIETFNYYFDNECEE